MTIECAVINLHHNKNKIINNKNKMELRLITKRIVLFVAIVSILLINNNIKGQSWSKEYVLSCDSSVYSLSQEKIIQGKAIDFFFPAYNCHQTSSMNAIEAVSFENSENIEIKFDSKNISCDIINFEIELYAESIDTIQIFLKNTDNRLVLVNQQAPPVGYTYLPAIDFSVNLADNDFKSIQIVGKSTNENSKFILGRLDGFKKVKFITNNLQALNSFISTYPVEQQGDLFYELPDRYMKIPGFDCLTQLVLTNCQTTHDSIRCISQFTDEFLNAYELYDVYGIKKDELLSRNALLTDTASDIASYYKGMKEIVASLNCCHIRLTTNQTEDVESPSQAVYFYNINSKIVVTAIFDPALYNTIRLGDKLLSINNVPIDQLYKDFSKYVYASTPQQREMKITQRLLYTAKEIWGDSLVLEFQNNTGDYYACLNKTNFSGKRVVPQGFKIASNDMIEKYNQIIYFRPSFNEKLLNSFMYSHAKDFNNCEGLIIDLRGNPGGDFSCLRLFSFLISKNSPILYIDSYLYNTHSNYIIKPSNKIQIQAPIVVIVDARTTCMGELLINGLRNSRSNIHVIGASNTAGSAQRAITTILPKNAILKHFDGMTKDALGKAIDDNAGIIPDSLVHFESYNDLLPYDDKLKCIAIDYLGRIANSK